MGNEFSAHKGSGSNKIFLRDIRIGIDVVMIYSSKSWWQWLGGYIFSINGQIFTYIKQGMVKRTVFVVKYPY